MNESSSSRTHDQRVVSVPSALALRLPSRPLLPSQPPAHSRRGVRRFAVLMASVLVACGSSGSGDPEPSRPTQRTEGSEQLKAFSGPDACARVAQDVRTRIGAVLDERLD